MCAIIFESTSESADAGRSRASFREGYSMFGFENWQEVERAHFDKNEQTLKFYTVLDWLRWLFGRQRVIEKQLLRVEINGCSPIERNRRKVKLTSLPTEKRQSSLLHKGYNQLESTVMFSKHKQEAGLITSKTHNMSGGNGPQSSFKSF